MDEQVVASSVAPERRINASAKLDALFKLGRPKFWFLLILPGVVGYLSTGEARPGPLALGIGTCCLITVAMNYLNHYMDRAEDRINLPRRVALVERVGYSNLVRLAAVLYIIAFALVPLFAWWTNLGTAVLYLIGVLASASYSYGLRAKRHPFLALLNASFVPALPFAVGWAMAKPIWEISPLVFVFVAFRFFNESHKNLRDEEGDRAAGVRTLFTSSLGSRRALVGLLLNGSPYVLIGLLLTGALPPRFVWMFILVPLAALVHVILQKAADLREKELLLQWNVIYLFTFTAVALLIYHPSIGSVIAVAVTYAFYFPYTWLGIDSRPGGMGPIAWMRFTADVLSK
jgi:4-hydroxybenzoate polyprenyltransferase